MDGGGCVRTTLSHDARPLEVNCGLGNMMALLGRKFPVFPSSILQHGCITLLCKLHIWNSTQRQHFYLRKLSFQYTPSLHIWWSVSDSLGHTLLNTEHSDQKIQRIQLTMIEYNCTTIPWLRLFYTLLPVLVTAFELPLATWRQTTGPCVVSGIVWWSTVPDWGVSAGRHTWCLAVCESERLPWRSCTEQSSFSNRCHTYVSTAKGVKKMTETQDTWCVFFFP